MRAKWSIVGVSLALWCFAAAAADRPPTLSGIVPGKSTKQQVEALLGAPWRVVQFNDCGEAMEGQADETWEYRGADPKGNYRIHVEFDDGGSVHLIARVPDISPGGKATIAKVAPDKPEHGMSMQDATTGPLDGREATRPSRWRARPGHISIIAWSAQSMAGDATMGWPPAATSLRPKPSRLFEKIATLQARGVRSLDWGWVR
jgi:hypothetical protein